jgi:hypothetical protein
MFVVDDPTFNTFLASVLPAGFEGSERNLVRTVGEMQRRSTPRAEAVSNNAVVSDVVTAWEVDASFCSTKVVDLNSRNISIELSNILKMRTVRVGLTENDFANNAAIGGSNGGEENLIDGSCLPNIAKLI